MAAYAAAELQKYLYQLSGEVAEIRADGASGADRTYRLILDEQLKTDLGTRCPRQKIRGILPWTNFPQSATVYSMQDWKYILEQMARMRLNFSMLKNVTEFRGQKSLFR